MLWSRLPLRIGILKVYGTLVPALKRANKLCLRNPGHFKVVMPCPARLARCGFVHSVPFVLFDASVRRAFALNVHIINNYMILFNINTNIQRTYPDALHPASLCVTTKADDGGTPLRHAVPCATARREDANTA